MSSNILLLGTIDETGRVDARPVIASTDCHGKVRSWAYLSGHEPHSTEVMRGLLRLPDLSINPIETTENRATQP